MSCFLSSEQEKRNKKENLIIFYTFVIKVIKITIYKIEKILRICYTSVK